MSDVMGVEANSGCLGRTAHANSPTHVSRRMDLIRGSFVFGCRPEHKKARTVPHIFAGNARISADIFSPKRRAGEDPPIRQIFARGGFIMSGGLRNQFKSAATNAGTSAGLSPPPFTSAQVQFPTPAIRQFTNG